MIFFIKTPCVRSVLFLYFNSSRDVKVAFHVFQACIGWGFETDGERRLSKVAGFILVVK